MLHPDRVRRTSLRWSLRLLSVSLISAALFGAGGSTGARGADNSPPATARPIHTAALTPSAQSLDSEADIPAPLSTVEANRYRRVFQLQKAGNWRGADQLISRIKDSTLLGQVLAQRYLHPAYRTSFAELSEWLRRYPDHPDGQRLYALALRRLPQGVASPTKPLVPARRSSTGAEADTEAEFGFRPAPRPSPQKASRVYRLRGAIEAHLEAGRLDIAEARFSTAVAGTLLDSVEIDTYRARVAAAHYYRSEVAEALRLARASAARSGADVPMAYWIAGLAAWRLDRIDEARRHFEALAGAENVSASMHAAGAYWASRVHLRARRPEKNSIWLARAAEHPRTFYGLLARRALGLPSTFDWDQRVLTDGDVAQLLRIPGGRRAAALLQIGQTKLAERELDFMSQSAGPELGRAVLALAQRANLAELAVRLGPRLAARDGRRHDSALYPVPRWRPVDGFKVDRALLYALMRVESGFRPEARSPRGAVGLMQILPSTAEYMARGMPTLGKRPNLLDPAVNMTVGQRYVLHLFRHDAVEGDLFRLVAAYNGGPGNLAKWRRRDEYDGDPLLFIESIPSRETRLFIEKVLTSYWIYRHRLNQPTPSLDAIAAGEWPTYTPLDKGAKSVAQNGAD